MPQVNPFCGPHRYRRKPMEATVIHLPPIRVRLAIDADTPDRTR